MSNLNKTYHKGKFRCGEWSKHLRPYLKRQGNKRFRKSALEFFDEELLMIPRRGKSNEKKIRVKITREHPTGWKSSSISKYRTLRDVENAMKANHVIRAIILDD